MERKLDDADAKPISLGSGDSTNIAADEMRGTIIVAFSGAPASLSTFAVVDPVARTLRQMNATWDNLATGLTVSSDGTNLYLLSGDQHAVVSESVRFFPSCCTPGERANEDFDRMTQ